MQTGTLLDEHARDGGEGLGHAMAGQGPADDNKRAKGGRGPSSRFSFSQNAVFWLALS